MAETTTKRTGSLTPREIANQALDEFAAYAMEPGIKPRIAERLEAVTGQTFARQQVARWLNPDPEKREIPNLGAGLLLALVINEMQHGGEDIGTNRQIVFSLSFKPKRKKTK
jgi:hypothetical protein